MNLALKNTLSVAVALTGATARAQQATLNRYSARHYQTDEARYENFTKATTVRLGMEWLMAPLLQNHHVHLIHHLYPGTPFYNNGKVWRLIEPELRQRDLAIQHGAAIHPTIYPAPADKAPA